MEKKLSFKKNEAKVEVVATQISKVSNNNTKNINIPQAPVDTGQPGFSSESIQRNPISQKTNTIGLVVADITNPFSSSLAHIIEEEAGKEGYTVLYGSSDENPDKFRRLIQTFLEKQVVGLIVVPPAGVEDQVKELENKGLPFLLLDRYFPEITTSYVALDNFQASYMAVNHLADHGHRRIGMITLDIPLFHMQERKRGFVKGLREHNLEIENNIIELNDRYLSTDMERAFDELLNKEKPVDALYLTTNRLGMYGLKYINSRKIKVPQQLAVISFDETEFLDLFSTPITQLRQPLEEMGYQAFHILIDSISNPHKITQLNLQPLLVIKGSSTNNVLAQQSPIVTIPAERIMPDKPFRKRKVKKSESKKKPKKPLNGDLRAPAL